MFRVDPIDAGAARGDHLAGPGNASLATRGGDEGSRGFAWPLAGWEGAAEVVARRDFDARGADLAPIPEALHPALARALAALGIHRLYRHQAEAVAAAAAGEDLVVATPTASGKSLCYTLPVLDALLREPGARALYLFPTKALARDQTVALRVLCEAAGVDLQVAVYDGDTPTAERRKARERARLLVTNPDMLHAGILPYHPRWMNLLGGLGWVVLDELHVYRGLFGSHVANVLRRLGRVAAFHGARPRFLCASATIGNPGEHAARLCGRPVRVIAGGGSGAGRRTFLIQAPPSLDPTSSRGGPLCAAQALVGRLHAAGLSTIVFCRTRTEVEVLLSALRAQGVAARAGDLDAIRGYRGGYLPGRRRAIERGLRSGEVRTVVATSALELGIDIGSLDAAVIVGWPGSRASVWQRAGRAGRRGAPSLAVLIARDHPIDRHVAAEPGWLFGESVEHARCAPDTPEVLTAHLLCAACELPFRDGDGYGPLGPEALSGALGEVARQGLLTRQGGPGGTRPGGLWAWVGATAPASEVSLRGPVEENFAVLDEPTGRVLAEVDLRDAPLTLHDGAIHIVEGEAHEVVRCDFPARKAFVRRVRADYYTQAIVERDLAVLAEQERDGAVARGEVHVAERVTGFKKLAIDTHENLGYGEVRLPDYAMHTRAAWLDARGDLPAGAALGAGAHGAARLLRHMGALLSMCESADLGRAVELLPGGTARITVYDAVPGGAGLCDGLYQRRGEWIDRAMDAAARCACARGCPACIGPAPAGAGDARALALRVLGCLRT